MKIQTLLEANLYRMQNLWPDSPNRLVKLSARPQRRAKGSSVNAYALAYALEKLGIDCPKRWKSTFCTTNADQSFFFTTNDGEGRRIIVQPTRLCGYVGDDFNMMPGTGINAEPILRAIKDTIKEFYVIIDAADPEKATPLLSLIGDINSLMKYGVVNSDKGYSEFLDTVDAVDQFLAKINRPTFTTRWVEQVDKYVKDGYIGAAMAKDIPNGNHEVWFEGNYAAQKMEVE